jgi:hypothetical protein
VDREAERVAVEDIGIFELADDDADVMDLAEHGLVLVSVTS